MAQLFFEKKADLFFVKWHQVRGYYSDQFWTVFFSDQLFKAYFFVKAQGRVDPAHKQMTYGLPFSFLKHDWKLYQFENLQQAHKQMYDIDIALKTGGSSAKREVNIGINITGIGFNVNGGLRQDGDRKSVV